MKIFCLICGKEKKKKDKEENVYNEFICSECEKLSIDKQKIEIEIENI